MDSSVLFATSGFDNMIKLWQTHTGVCLHTFKHPNSQVNALAFSNNNRFLAAAGYEHVRLYDPINLIHEWQVQIQFQRNVNALGFNSDGRWMYTAGEDGAARIFDLRTKNHTCLQIFQARGCINTAVLYHNDRELILGDELGEVNIWDIRCDANNQMLKPDTTGICGSPAVSAQSLALNADGTSLAMLNAHGTCYVWSLGGTTATVSSTRTKIDKLVKYGLKVEFSPDSTLMVLCDADRQFKVLKTADFSVLASYGISTMRWVWDCAFSADSQYLLTASSDGIGRLWNMDNGQVVKEYRGHQKAITCLAFKDSSAEIL